MATAATKGKRQIVTKVKLPARTRVETQTFTNGEQVMVITSEQPLKWMGIDKDGCKDNLVSM